MLTVRLADYLEITMTTTTTTTESTAPSLNAAYDFLFTLNTPCPENVSP